MQAGNYANTRYSALNQINGGQRQGSEGRLDLLDRRAARPRGPAPWSIGNTMYVHTPFPNIVYALDLDHDGKIIWKYEPKQDPCDPGHVLRPRQPRPRLRGRQDLPDQADTTSRARRQDRQGGVEGRRTATPKKGQTDTGAPLIVKDKVIVGISGGEFGVRGYLTAYDLKTGKQVWRA